MKLSDILARCDEVGECMLWQGGMTGMGLPIARLRSGDSPTSLRRHVFVLSIRELRPGECVWTSCGESRCLHPAHLRAGTRPQMLLALRRAGRYRSVAMTMQRIQAGRMRGKITLEIARAIRVSDEPATAHAERYGIDVSLVRRIRRGEAWRETAPGASVFSIGG